MESFEDPRGPNEAGGRVERVERNEAAYCAGYARTMREVELGRAMGWRPTERQLVIALSRASRIYSSARRGKPVGGQHPDWLKGRADALRALLRQGVGSLSEDE
jgi:hypothetical protein